MPYTGTTATSATCTYHNTTSSAHIYTTSSAHTYNPTIWNWIPTEIHPPKLTEEQASIEVKEQANKKALALLKSMLTKQQLEAFERDECIPVDTAKGNKYLIKKGRVKNIHVLDDTGKTSRRLCIHPNVDCPDYDTMLAQLMFIRHNEDELLRVANQHPA